MTCRGGKCCEYRKEESEAGHHDVSLAFCPKSTQATGDRLKAVDCIFRCLYQKSRWLDLSIGVIGSAGDSSCVICTSCSRLISTAAWQGRRLGLACRSLPYRR